MSTTSSSVESSTTPNPEIGPGLEALDMGPQVGESGRDSTLDYIEVGQTEGAILEMGGDVPEDDRLPKGYLTEPMVFFSVESTMRIAQEGTFGPLPAVTGVDGFDEAIDIANDIDYGLSESIIIEDHGEADRFVDRTEVGVAKVNRKTTGLELHMPFGGYKRSSSEALCEQGYAGLQFYTISKTVYDAY